MLRTKSISSVKWGFPFLGPDRAEPSPFIYQIGFDHEVGPGILFHDSCVKIAHAHRKHSEGNRYICYGTWVGVGLVWLMYPLEKESDLQKLLPDEKALLETSDGEDGEPAKLVRDLQSTIISEKRNILKYLPNASNLPKDIEDAPYDYIYYIVVKPNNNIKNSRFSEIVQKFIDINNDSKNGYNWITYMNEGNSEAHIFVPMRKFCQMDNWKELKDIASGASYNEAEEVRSEMYAAVDKLETHIMTFVPSCDNSGFEFNE